MSDEAETKASEQPQPDAFDEAFEAAMKAVEGDGEDEEQASEAKPDEAETSESSEESTEGADEAQETEAKAEADPEADAASEDPEPLDTPSHWSNADRDAFAELDRSAQEFLLERDKYYQGQFTKKSQELSEQAKFAESIRGLFTEADRQQMAIAGMDETATINRLVALQRQATTDPAAYLQSAAQMLGVDLNALIPQSPDQTTTEDDEWLDPTVKDLRNQVTQLESKLNGFETQAQTSQQAQNQLIIERFRTATDDDGNSKYPHYATVERTMGALMQTSPTIMNEADPMKALEQAYDMAVMADPTLREEKIAQMAQSQIAADTKARELEKAKRAASPVKPKPTQSAKPDIAGMSLDQQIDHVLDQFGVE